MAKTESAITLTQMRYFVRVAELSSMSAAADELFVAPSAVSMAISQLEQAVGCQLLMRRRSKGVALTDQGRIFYPHCLRILTGVKDAVDSVRTGALGGRLTAGCFTTLAQFWIPDIVEGIHASHPGVDVDIRECDADQLEEALSQRKIEAALAYDFDYGREIEFVPMGTAPLYAVFGDGHRFAHAEKVELRSLASDPLVLLDLGKSSNYFLSAFREAGVEPLVSYRFESFEIVRSMVARGYGYSVLNQSPVHDLTNEGLHLNRVPIVGAGEGLRLGVIKRRGENLSLRAELFVDTVRLLLQERR